MIPAQACILKKGECVGHVQKRLGTHLRNLRTKLKGTKLSDGKPLIGKGRLTEKIINLLQNYYGMAIRQNAKTVPEMRKAIGAVLCHCSESSSEETHHLYCPKDKDTWCKWQNVKLTGENKYNEKLPIPKVIKEILLPIIKDLSDPQLPEKYLHGQTRNVNESLNRIIWQKCPKNLLVSRQVSETEASSAVLEYNDGAGAKTNVIKRISVDLGMFFVK